MKNRLLGLGLLALPLLSCTERETTSAPPPPLVKAFTVASRTEGPLHLRGSVASQSRIKLGFKLPGVVTEVLATDGDRVRKGQLVARLDDVDARSQLRMAVAQREKARRDAERAARLSEEGAVATGVRDDARSQLEAAEAQVAQAEAAVARTKLLAPESGTVFTRLAEPGETVGAGNPILILDTTGALVVRAATTDRELRGLRLAQPARLTPEDGGPAFSGRVTSIATTPNPADGLYPVEVTPLGSPPLRPGALVRISIDKGSKAASLRIPLDALVHRQDLDFVFVLDGGPRVRQVPIEIDEVEGREAVVRSGLSGGSRIVAEGAYFLQDGQSVRTVE